MLMNLPARVMITEVGPRDGLQNEPAPVPAAAKIAFINALADAGLTQIEATSFVHPKAVPQLADAEEVCRGLPSRPEVTFSALTPNLRGYERAAACGVRRIAVFTAASETFARRNINMSIAESLSTFESVMRAARRDGVSVRGYVSTCFACPYEGEVDRRRVLEVTRALLDLGVDEAAISDTIGTAAPTDVFTTVGYVLQHVPRERIALHFHDTCGTALANVAAGLELGVTRFDGSAGGLGGCPYAPGAAGNLATEDLVYMLERMNVSTGVDLRKLVAAARGIHEAIGGKAPSRQMRRLEPGRGT
ncbi:MAG: Hydroxymethylglutaryl-CoA lyase YngG [Phycisphaerae bacterium]|nr:Hydroxymethylglutaryl-CoA lyase YngG [Phycisphaerae bacterium]